MKKTERINLIMRYINNRAHFTIAELQKEFEISRATAIRDVQQIQEMGFPIFATVGRGGGYDVMQNQYLPAVHFTPDELRAIFISFIASKNSQLPYLQNRQSITEKLVAIASQTQQDELIGLGDLLLFENTNPANPNILELDDYAPDELNQLITLASKNRHLRVTYEKTAGWPELMDIWLLHIFNTNGQWLVEAYDFESEIFCYLPVEFLRHSAFSEQLTALSASEILEKKRKNIQQANLVVNLDAVGIQRFKRLHPPGIILAFTGMFQSSGQFSVELDVNDTDQLNYFADWLFFLGAGVHFEKIPDALDARIKSRIDRMVSK